MCEEEEGKRDDLKKERATGVALDVGLHLYSPKRYCQ